MNKKLLVVAIAAALAPVAAMADSGNVTIYGQMNASIDSVNSGYDNDQRTTQISDNSSRLGFKGTEALGNGLTAVWQIESAISADGQTAGGFNTRNTFVGMTGNFGTAILGRHDTPYKLATRSLDVFGDNIADNRSIMGKGFASFDGRQSNVAAYISPSFSGFTGAIAYVAGAETAYTSSTKGDAWSAMGTYANGPIFASVAFEKHNVGDAGTGTLGVAGHGGQNEKAWKLGAGYNMGAFKVGLAYEKTKDELNAGSDLFGHHAFYLSGAYTMGANVIKAAYTKAGDFASASNTGAKQFSLGFDHNMSKRTTVYALYSKLNNDDAGTYGLIGGSNGGVPGVANADPSVFSLGMKHSF